MQPLSYQVLPNSCWVTSMLNGLLLLNGDKNKMSGLVYRILHAVLTDDGVCTSGRPGNDWITVLEAIQIHTNLHIKVYLGADVEPALRKLKFSNQVAVCDIEAGGHSILLTGRSGRWIDAFDPDWNNIKMRRNKPNAYVVQPDEIRQHRLARVNVLIIEDYLLRSGRGRKGDFQMGAVATRILITLEKRRAK